MNLTVAEIAKRLNVTTTTIYKAIKTNPAVKAFVTKNGERKTLIDEQAIALLADSIRIQSDRIGSNPDSIGAQADTGAGFKPETAGLNPDSNLVELIQTLKNQIESKDGQIHELLGQMRDKDHRHDTIIMTLSKQLNDQAKQIEDLRNHHVATESSTFIVERAIEDDGKPSILNHRVWDKMQKDFDAFMKTQAA